MHYTRTMPGADSTTPSMSQSQAGGSSPRFGDRWIGGRWIDLCLIIGVPLFLLPLIVAAPGRPDVQELILYLGAFGALGHHLPGMLRAYGDRELFRRFRLRFVLAPLFLVAVCVGFSLAGLGGIVLATFLWTTWHTLMQVFGFARIYDAKGDARSGAAVRVAGPAAKRASLLDQALCIGWILAPLAWSDRRVAYALELYYRCGLPRIQSAAIDGARQALLAATALVTLGFLARLCIDIVRGARPPAQKLLFLAASFGFWWYCMVEVEHLVAGVALFDVFHDVQYLAIVWLFQRARVREAGASGGVTGFTRFLFRESGALRGLVVGLYVALVVGYGSVGYFSGKVASETVREVLLGVLAASALFHFYLDGFVWKVREPGTRSALGIAETRAAEGGSPWRWTQHAWKWAFFVVPLAWFGVAESRGAAAPADWRGWIAEAAPGSPEALTNLGVELASRGELERAIELHRRALSLAPGLPEPHNNLGAALRLAGRPDEAQAEFETAIRLRPKYARAHGHLANLLVQRGDAARAERHFRAAIEHDPRYADARANLALLCVARGELPEALALLREALAIDPRHRGALNNLAWNLATSSRADLRSPAEALALAERLVELTGRSQPQPLDTLAAAEAACGRFEAAARTATEAAETAHGRGNAALAAQIESRLELYRARRAYQSP